MTSVAAVNAPVLQTDMTTCVTVAVCSDCFGCSLLHVFPNSFQPTQPNRTANFAAEAVATLNRRLAQAPADNWFASNM